MRWWSVALAPLLIAAACSGYEVPSSHVRAARSSIGVAERQGVSSVPAAANRLAVAERELATAHRLSERGDKRSADLMYLRADADARLATSMAQNVRATAETQQILRQAQQIQGQLRSMMQQPSMRPSQPSEPSQAPAPPSPETNP